MTLPVASEGMVTPITSSSPAVIFWAVTVVVEGNRGDEPLSVTVNVAVSLVLDLYLSSPGYSAVTLYVPAARPCKVFCPVPPDVVIS